MCFGHSMQDSENGCIYFSLFLETTVITHTSFTIPTQFKKCFISASSCSTIPPCRYLNVYCRTQMYILLFYRVRPNGEQSLNGILAHAWSPSNLAAHGIHGI